MPLSLQKEVCYNSVIRSCRTPVEKPVWRLISAKNATASASWYFVGSVCPCILVEKQVCTCFNFNWHIGPCGSQRFNNCPFQSSQSWSFTCCLCSYAKMYSHSFTPCYSHFSHLLSVVLHYLSQTLPGNIITFMPCFILWKPGNPFVGMEGDYHEIFRNPWRG